MARPLPGLAAHRRLVPPERRPDLGKAFPNERRVAAVLALLYPMNDRVCCALIRRPSYPGVHGGQIAFPGGQVESEDSDLLHTALREAWEEVGIQAEKVQRPTELTRLYIPPSRYEVVPFLGLSDRRPDFILQTSEVDELIELPLEELMQPNVYGEVSVHTTRGLLNVPAYQWRDEIIWGATAMIVAEISDVLNDIHSA
ncbi:MAG: CoA pyrophosphatase [Flavobacteriia bacterium]|nr:CoA pyrophosphatase [Flavobacteriia bacterium]